MSRWMRLIVFGLGAAGLAALWAAALMHLPGPPRWRDRYLLAITRRAFAERNVTDLVSAVNFDYRGFDTLGEEFILFASVVGSVILLRQAEDHERRNLRDAVTTGRNIRATDAMRFWILAMIGPKIVFGIYVVIHGQLTPGGGFQGGVILASAALIIYLGLNFQAFKRIMSHPLVELGEAAGAAAFVLVGFIGWFSGKPFLTNTLPLGKTGALTSGGMIPIISGAVGIEVAAGFVLLLYAFLQETLTLNKDD